MFLLLFWMMTNKLWMIDNETEVMIVALKRFIDPYLCQNHWIMVTLSSGLVKSLRNLDVIFDSSLSLWQQIISTWGTAYLELRHISTICKSLTVDAAKNHDHWYSLDLTSSLRSAVICLCGFMALFCYINFSFLMCLKQLIFWLYVIYV